MSDKPDNVFLSKKIIDSNQTIKFRTSDHDEEYIKKSTHDDLVEEKNGDIDVCCNKVLNLNDQVAALKADNDRMRVSLIDSDILAKTIDDQVRLGTLNSRSAISDSRLNYGNPDEYKWMPIPDSTPDLTSNNECDHDWEDIGMGRKQCTYSNCQVIEDFTEDEEKAYLDIDRTTDKGDL